MIIIPKIYASIEISTPSETDTIEMSRNFVNEFHIFNLQFFVKYPFLDRRRQRLIAGTYRNDK